MNRIDLQDDDCRGLRGGAFYYRHPNLKGGLDANCLTFEGRLQFGFRLAHDDLRASGELETPLGCDHQTGAGTMPTMGREVRTERVKTYNNVGIRLSRRST